MARRLALSIHPLAQQGAPGNLLSSGMGIKNYLIEGVSGTGKTSVAEELQRRGYHVIHGDRALAYRGDPKTGEPLDGLAQTSEADGVAWAHKHWIWDVDKVKSL